jgi:hypothetical protein
LKFSAFSRLGFFQFVGGNVQPAPQRHYDALVAQLGKAFDLTPGLPTSEDNEAEVFANAYNLARAEITLKKAGYQRDVSKVTDLLTLQEASFQATPLPTDTLWQRQQRLLALKALNIGASASNIRGVLSKALGSAFVGLRICTLSSGEAFADLPTSNFQPLNLVGKWLKLVAPVGLTGSQWASYGMLDPTVPFDDPLALGDVVTVQGENNVVAEAVTVTGLRTVAGTDASGAATVVQQFQAVFGFGHDTDATITTSTFPRWTSSVAILLVEVTPAASVDMNTRAMVDAIMQKVCRGTCQWATVSSNGVSIGPFLVGISPLGTAPMFALLA